MKLGHFVALCCFLLALVFAGVFYWDVQDGTFSLRLLYLPIMCGSMAVVFLLFPGGPFTFREAATGPAGLGGWLDTIPRLHRRAWVAAAGVAIYLSIGASDLLEGKPFFTLGTQLLYLFVAFVLWLIFRKRFRGLWG
ncbi:hypothetical protein GCM10027422_27500 [Hymenobacter arcticus]